MDVIEQKTQFGVNYDVGYDGFTSHPKDFITAGINWFERWDKLPGIPPVSHTFKIVGEDQTVEAFGNGVRYGKLSDYLNDPNCALMVRKPMKWTPDMGRRLAAAAKSHIGERYNYFLIVMMALGNTFLGHGINKLSGGKFSNWLDELADSKKSSICSQLVSRVNNSVIELRNWGVLRLPPYDVTPLLLLQDKMIYEPGIIELIP